MATSAPLHRAVGALVTTLLSLGLALAGAVAAAGPASAEEGYRYWNYFHADGEAFRFADTGPADYTPKDGDVEGWRYGTSSESAGIEPRADLTEVSFETVCKGTDAAAGEKRVAVLVDYGVEADADGAEVPEPAALCAVVPEDANGQQTLESVAPLRIEDGGICAVDGYPATGCFATVKNADVDADQGTVPFTLPAAATADEQADGAAASDEATETAASESDSGVSWPLVAVIGLVVVLGVVAVPLYRRNRES